MQVFRLIVHLAKQQSDLRLELLECHGLTLLASQLAITIGGYRQDRQFRRILIPTILLGFC
jgi:hypothetical protein